MGSNYELNKGDQFIFVIDYSRSMMTRDCPGNTPRMDAIKETVITFAGEAGKYDPDGLDVILFAHDVKHLGAITPGEAADKIRPLQATGSSTDTAAAVRLATKLWKDKASPENTVVFIATDGEPNDIDALKSALCDAAAMQEADKETLSFSFLIIGEPDAKLTAALDEIDDNLNAKDKNGAPIDIVDWKKLLEVDFATAFDGAVHD